MLIEHILYRKGHDVATITPQSSVADAVARLRELNIGALVVREDDAGAPIAGVFSERDVVRALTTVGAQTLDHPVADLMTTDVATCTPRGTVEELMRVMTDRRIRHVPVVEGGELRGIVSIGDVVKSRIDELQEEADTLHEYLSSGRT
ncbi:MAG TPA: CBS domain-containing protein [Acidimicrobiales bacterium]